MVFTHYATLFSGKLGGKLFTEFTNGYDTVSEAIEATRELYEDGRNILGLYAIDVSGRDPVQRIFTSEQLIERLSK